MFAHKWRLGPRTPGTASRGEPGALVSTRTSFQPHLQGLRGVAAFIVVVSHYVGAFYPAAHSGDSRPTHLGWDILFAQTPLALAISGCFAVCVFFVLSGYVLTLPYMKPSASKPRLWASLLKRQIRLFGIIAFSMILSFVLNRLGLYFNTYAAFLTKSGWFAVQVNPPKGVLPFLEDLIGRPFATAQNYSGPLWTMPLEFYGGVGSFLFALVFARSSFRWLAYPVALALVRNQFYAGFVFGIFFADLANNVPAWLASWNRRWCLALAVPAAIYFSGFPYYAYLSGNLAHSPWYGFLPGFPFLGGSYCMIGAVLVFAIVLVNPHCQGFFARPALVYLGWLSFALYAVHFLILRSFSAWLFVALSPYLTYNLDVLVTFVAGLLVILPLSHWISVLVDEPSIRLADLFARRFLLVVETVTSKLPQKKAVAAWSNLELSE